MNAKLTLKVWLLFSLLQVTIMNALASSDSISNPLNDTKWRLIEFQSMDDQIGIVRPWKSSLYAMTLNADGLVMQLNYNRGRGRWSAPRAVAPTAVILRLPCML